MRKPAWVERLLRRWRRRSSSKRGRDDSRLRFQLSRLEERRVLSVTVGQLGADTLQISMDAAGDTADVSVDAGNVQVNGVNVGFAVNSIVVEATSDDNQTLKISSDLNLADGISVLAAEDVESIIVDESITSTTGDIILEADSQLVLGANGDLLSDSGDITLRADQLSVTATNLIDADADGASSLGGNILISASRLGLGEINTDADLTLIATAEEVTDQANISVGGLLDVNAQSFIHLDSLDASGGMRIATATGSATIVNDLDLDLRDADIATDLTVTSSNGSISDAGGGVLDAIEVGANVQLNAKLNIDLDSLDAIGDIGLSAGGNASLVNVGDINLNASDVDGDLEVTSTTGNVSDSGPGATSNASPLKFDFNRDASSATPSDYTALLPTQLYNVTDGFGWESTVDGFDRTLHSDPRRDLRKDGHSGTTSAVFRVDLANGDYFVNITVGDAVVANDDIRITMLGATNQVLFDDIDHARNRWRQDSVLVSVVNGVLRLEISDQGGANRWVINSLEITPVTANSAVATMVPGFVPADGATVDTISGTGLANAIYTVSADLGQIIGVDTESVFEGHQIQAAADGTFSFGFQRPTIPGLANLAIESLDGLGNIHLDQPDELSYYRAPILSLDLNRTIVEPGYAGVSDSQIFAPTNGVGWASPVSSFAWTGSLGPPEELLRDGHFGNSPATFQVAVEAGKTYEITTIMANIGGNHPGIGVDIEGVPAFLINYAIGTVEQNTTTVTMADNVLDITLSTSSSNPWILNGLIVKELNPGAPPAVEPSFKGQAGVVSASGDATFNAPQGKVELDDIDIVGLVHLDALNSSTVTTDDLSLGTVVVSGAGQDFTASSSTGDVTLGDLTVNDRVTISAAAGSILDDADAAAIDITANSAVLSASNSFGTTANPLETALTHIEVLAGGDVVFGNSGDLTIGGLSPLNGVVSGGNIWLGGSANVTLDEALEANDRVTVVTGGNLLDDGDIDIDLSAMETVISAVDVGQAGDAIEISVANLEGDNTGDVFLSNDQLLTIGGLGVAPGFNAAGGVTLNNPANVFLDGPLSAGGLLQLDIVGSLLDDGDAGLDVSAGMAVLNVTGDVGQSGTPLQSQLLFFEGNIGGGLFLASSSAMTLGAASAGSSGVTAAQLEITSTGKISIVENVAALSGGISLQSDIQIDIGAALLTFGQSIVIDAGNDLTFLATGLVDSQASANLDIAAGGKLQMADGAQVDARGGDLSVDVQDDAVIAALRSIGGAVQVTTASGAIRDGGSSHKDIQAQTAVLSAAGEIGEDANLLETLLSQLEARAESIYIENMGDLIVGDLSGIDGLSADNNIRLINLGDLRIHESLGAVNLISLLITGDLIDEPNLDLDIITSSLVLDVSGDVGLSDALETQVNAIEGDVGGDIRLRNSGPLTIGNVTAGEDGLSGNSIDVVATGDIIVAEDVVSQNGSLRLSSDADLQVNAAVTSNGNSIELTADGDLSFSAAGVVDSLSSAAVTISTSGALLMADGSVVNARGGAVVVNAANDAAIGSLQSVGGMVSVFSSAGSIVDGGDSQKEIDAFAAVLSAANNIGSSADVLEVNLSRLEALATADVWIANMGQLEIGGIGAMDGVSAGAVVNLTNNADILLNEGIRATNVQLNVNGSLLDDADADLDIEATRLLIETTIDVGTAVDLLETQVDKLEGDVSGDINLHNAASLAIGDVDAGFTGLQVGGNLQLNGDLNLVLDETLDVVGNAVIALAGSATDDNDAQLDLKAASLALTVGGNAGASADTIESDIDVLEIMAGGDIAISNSGTLQVGGLGAIVGIRSTAGNVLLINDDSVLLDETIAATIVEVRASGSLLDNDSDLDIVAGRAIVTTTVDFGALLDPLELGVDQLEATAGGDLFAGNDRDLQIGGDNAVDGVQAVGQIRFSNIGNVILDEQLAAGGAMLLSASGDVHDDGDAAIDLNAQSLRLDVGGGFGKSNDKIETALGTVEGNVNDSLFIHNDQTLAIGGANAVNGLAVGGALCLVNQGDLMLDELLSVGGLADLTITGGLLDDGDADLDFDALQALIRTTDSIGVSTDRVEMVVAAIEVDSGSDVFFHNASQLTVGGVNGLNGVAASGDVDIETTGDLVLDESISGSSITLNVDGSILDDGDSDLDLIALDGLLNATISIGIAGDELQTQFEHLEGVAGDDVILDNTGALTIGAVSGGNGLSAGGRIELTNDNDVLLNETLLAGSDLIANINGDLLDDGDADLDLVAARAELNVTGNAGLVADALESALGNLEGVLGGGLVVVDTGDLTIGGVNGLSGIDATGDLVMDVAGDLILDELISAANVILNVDGSVLDDGDADLDLFAATAQLNASESLGTVGDALESQLGRLEGLVGDDAFLNNSGMLIIGAISGFNGLNAGGRIELTNDANVLLDETLRAGGSIFVNIAGNLLDDGDADLDIIAAGAEFNVAGAAGKTADALDTDIRNLEGVIGAELVMVNTGALTIGGVNGSVAGLRSGSADLRSTGVLQIGESMQTVGDAKLQSDDDIAIFANIQTAGADVSLSAGDALQMADGAVIKALGGGIQVQALNDVHLSSLMTQGGAVTVHSAAGGIFDVGDAHKEIDAATASLRAAGNIGLDSNELETRLAQLESESGSIFIDNMGDLTIGGVNGLDGVQAGVGEVRLNNNGDVRIHEVISAADQVHLIVTGSVLDQPNPDTDIVAARLLLNVSGDFGLAMNGIELQVANLEGIVGNGLVANNAGSLTIGGVSATMTGLQTGSVDISATDAIQVDEDITATGDVLLRAGADASGGDALTMSGGATLAGDNVTLQATQDIVISFATAVSDLLVLADGRIRDHGADTLNDVAAGGVLTLRAGAGIDGPSPNGKLDIAGGATVDAVVAGQGPLALQINGPAVIRQARTADGPIEIMTSGQTEVQLVDAGDADSSGNGRVAIMNAVGDVLLGRVNAVNEVTIQANSGSILDMAGDADVDVTAGGLIRLAAFGDIAAPNGESLELADGSIVEAVSLFAGEVRIDSPGSLTVTKLTTQDGNGRAQSSADLVLQQVDVRGDFFAQSTNGDITNPNGQVRVSGASEFRAASSTGAIDLGQVDTARLSGPVALLSGADAALTNLLDINFDTTNIGGDLIAVSQGNLLNGAGSITVAGMAAFDAAQVIKLGIANALNIGQSLGVVSGGDSILKTDNAIDFKTSTVAGNLMAESSGAITNDGGSLTVGQMSSLKATEIRLGTTQSFSSGGAVGVETIGDVEIETSSNLDFKASTVGGDLIVSLDGAQLSDSGLLQVVGDASLNTTGAGGHVTLDQLDLSGGLSVDSGGNASIKNQTALDIAEGAAQSKMRLEALSGGIRYRNGLTAGTSIQLAAELDVEGAGTLAAPSITISAGAGIGDLARLSLQTQLLDVVSTSDGEIDLVNESALDVTVSNLSTLGGNILLTLKSLGHTTFTGNVTSGDPIAGGNIEINADSGVTVAATATLSSLTGSGGLLRIGGATVNTVPLVGAGDIIIRGGGGDVIIDVDIITDVDVDIFADRDIIVKALVQTTDGANISLTADADMDGVGGVWVQTIAEIDSDGDLTLVGSDLFATPGERDAIVIDADPGGFQTRARSDTNLLGRDLTPDAAIVIDGKVETLSATSTIAVVGLDLRLVPATGALSAPNGLVQLAATAGDKLVLGGSQANTFSLDPMELAAISADVILVGDPNGGGELFVQGRVESTLPLVLASAVSIHGPGVLAVEQLGFLGSSQIELTGANEVETLSAMLSGGELQFASSGHLVIGALGGAGDLPDIVGVTGGGGLISITANSPLTVMENVTNSGDIRLTASSSLGVDDLTLNARVISTGDGTVELSAGDDIVVRDSGADPEVFAHGNGPIIFRAGGDVLIDDDVSMGSEFGRFVTFPQVEEDVTIFVEPIDQGGSNVDAFGVAKVNVRVGVPGENNYRLTVDWSDGVVEEYPFQYVGSGESGPLRIPGDVTMTLTHRYRGNPSSNPADPIPVRVTVGLDAQLTDNDRVISGIQFFTNGNFGEPLATTVVRFQTVPGEGIQTYIPPVIHELDPIVARSRNSGWLGSQAANGADSESESFGVQSGELEVSQIGKTRVFFRVVDDVAKTEAAKEIDLPVDSLENVLDEFKKIKLRNGHYRIYIDDPATGRIRLMHDLHLFNGRLVPPNFREGVGDDVPKNDKPDDDVREDVKPDDERDIQPRDDKGAMLRQDVPLQLQAAVDGCATRFVAQARMDQRGAFGVGSLDTVGATIAMSQDPAPGITAPGITASGITASGITASGITAPGIAAPENADEQCSHAEPLSRRAEYLIQSANSWRRVGRIAAVAAGATALAATVSWNQKLIEAESQQPIDLSRTARRRRRLMRAHNDDE